MIDYRYWHLNDYVSIVDAALLILEVDPVVHKNVLSADEKDKPKNFTAVFKALKNAVLNKDIKAIVRRRAWERGWDESPEENERFTKKIVLFPEDDYSYDGGIHIRGVIYRAEPDWELTQIHVDNLKIWLSNKTIMPSFFFPQETARPDYLDINHLNYAPKLAAAIEAWQAVTEQPALAKGRSIKQALQKWLRENASRFGLTKDDGCPNEQGIEEIAKISNWDFKGGAPKTP